MSGTELVWLYVSIANVSIIKPTQDEMEPLHRGGISPSACFVVVLLEPSVFERLSLVSSLSAPGEPARFLDFLHDDRPLLIGPGGIPPSSILNPLNADPIQSIGTKKPLTII